VTVKATGAARAAPAPAFVEKSMTNAIMKFCWHPTMTPAQEPAPSEPMQWKGMRLLSLTLDAAGFLIFAFLIMICDEVIREWRSSAPVWLAASSAACAATAMLVRERIRRRADLSAAAVGWRDGRPVDIGWAVVTAVLVVAIVELWIGAGLPTTEKGAVGFVSPGWLAPDASLVFMFGAIAAHAISEELIFRSYLIPRCESELGTAGALIVTSLLFGLVHGGSWMMHSLSGLALGFCFVRTRGIAAPAFAHVLVNFWFIGRGYTLFFGGSGG